MTAVHWMSDTHHGVTPCGELTTAVTVSRWLSVVTCAACRQSFPYRRAAAVLAARRPR